MLKDSPMFVNMVFDSLVSFLDSQPILELSVQQFLWGYDDRLVKMASNVLPTWINFSKFGLLDRVTIAAFSTNNEYYLIIFVIPLDVDLFNA